MGASRGPGQDPDRRSSREGEGERRVRRGADLILERELLTGPAPLPDFARLLAARSSRGRRRYGLGVVGGVAVAAVAAVAFLQDLSPVSYLVAGEAAVTGSRISAAPTGQPARIRFSDGTEVTLGPSAALDVVTRSGRGAVVALEHGEARFSVVHRRGAKWTVVTGPFAIEVTGTEFVVDWRPEAGRMVVDLKGGSVRVRGTSVGGAIELHAGERLVATVADHRITLSPSAEEAGHGVASVRGRGREARAPGAEAEPAVETPGRGDSPASLRSADDANPPEASPSRVVVDAPQRMAGRAAVPRTLALGSPRARARVELPEQRVPSLGAVGDAAGRAPLAEGPRVDPPPAAVPFVPGVPQSLTLGGGGLFCVNVPAQYTFEQPVSGLGVPALFTTAFAGPRLDRTHSWCGESSVRLEANFDDSGRQNFFGRFPNETGQLFIKLDHPTDLTGQTVTMHVFVDGPWDARFSAELAVADHGRWISNNPSRGLTPGRWWTVSHHFTEDNASGVPGSSNPMPFPNGGRSGVSEVDRLALAIRTTGERRTWRGAVYVDDISWR